MNIFKWLTNKKYRIFSKKVQDVQISMWELDFKIAKSRQIREGVRMDRDRAIEAIQRIDAALKSGPNEQYEAEKKVFEDNVKRYEAQMKMVDEQINGVPAQGENPGQEGIQDRLKALAELRAMYQEYLKTI